jgi:hypothetical protein
MALLYRHRCLAVTGPVEVVFNIISTAWVSLTCILLEYLTDALSKVAEKQAWYRRNTRVNAPFPLLPLDRSSAPSLDFATWRGPWTKLDKAINIRSSALSLFGGQGSVKVSVCNPSSPIAIIYCVFSGSSAASRILTSLYPDSLPNSRRLLLKADVFFQFI